MLNTITLFFYSAGALSQAVTLIKNPRLLGFFFSLFGIPAFLIHGYLLYSWIDLAAGQNLTEQNLLSLAAWVTAIIIWLLTLKQPVAYMGLLIFPLAASSIFVVGHFPASHILQTGQDFRQLMHILLSVVTFSVLTIAALQAVTLAFQEKFLRQKNLTIANALPPIETTEKLLFQAIATGSVLLTLVLATSIYFYQHLLLHQFFQKTLLTFVVWLVFCFLLGGRYFFGWRGKKAIYFTLSGVALLSLIYLGSLIIMELLP